MRFLKFALFLSMLTVISTSIGCMSANEHYRQTHGPKEKEVTVGTVQSDESKLLEASAALLQDLGFTIDESEVKCGVIVCSRDRNVTEPYDVAISIAASVFFIDDEYATRQKALATLVTRPLVEDRIAVRITFQHLVWDTKKELIKNERVNEPEIYIACCVQLSPRCRIWDLSSMMLTRI